jgi:hypothetical protein
VLRPICLLVLAVAVLVAPSSASASTFEAASTHALAPKAFFLGAQPPLKLRLTGTTDQESHVKVALARPGESCMDYVSEYGYSDEHQFLFLSEVPNVDFEAVRTFGALDQYGDWSLCAATFSDDRGWVEPTTVFEPVVVRVTRVCTSAHGARKRAAGRLSAARQRVAAGGGSAGEVRRRQAELRRADARMLSFC